MSQTLTRPRFAVANASAVTSHLWTGGDLVYNNARATAQMQELVDNGVTAMVDCRLEASDESFVNDLAPQVEYLHLPVDDHGDAMPAWWFERGTDFIRAHVDATDLARVLVHCHMGVNRGPSLTYAAMLAAGWDAIEAMDAIVEARPVAWVLYAEDALDWHLGMIGASPERRTLERRRLATWRAEHREQEANAQRAIRAHHERDRLDWNGEAR